MSTRYDDRDYGRYDREGERYGRRSDFDYGGSYGERSRRSYGSSRGRDIDRERFGREGDYERYGRAGSYGEYGRDYGSTSGRSERDYGLRTNYEDYDRESEYRTRGGNAGYQREFDRPWGGEPLYGTGPAFGGRLYGSRPSMGSSFDYDRGSYREPSRRYSQRYNYPSGYRSGQTYGRSYDRSSEYDRDYDLGERGERGWWDRASDEVASWFGDEEAERRRNLDRMRESTYRGRGPRGYTRSDERIKEDVNDRLSDDPYIDASDVEAMVANREITLTGTVDDRDAKRRAEDIAESVSGVSNVENRLRIRGRTIEGATTTEATHGSAISRMAAAGASSSGTSSGSTSTTERNRTTL